MELRYPYLIIIVAIIIIIYLILAKNKGTKYVHGSKIANTKYVKNTDYFKKKLRTYKYFKLLTLSLFIIAIISSTILLTRLSSTKTINNDIYNRDIYLCMDTSSSVDELNLELVDNLIDTVNKLHGERFGISIFNTSSVLLVPLTDDYDYIINVLKEIKKSLETYTTSSYEIDNDDYFYVRNYIVSGTLEDNTTRGSSLIGDGLASCVYSFPENDKERTKIIIFSTDNDLEGRPLVTLNEAAKIAKDEGIKVFSIGTKVMDKTNESDLQNAALLTGGKYYKHSQNTVNNIVNDIDSTSKTILKNQVSTQKTDIPQIPFIILMISLSGILLINKKVIK